MQSSKPYCNSTFNGANKKESARHLMCVLHFFVAISSKSGLWKTTFNALLGFI